MSRKSAGRKPRDGMRIVKFLLIAGKRDARQLRLVDLPKVLTVNIDRYLSGLNVDEIAAAFHTVRFLFMMESDPHSERILRSVGYCLARTYDDRTATRH